MKKESAAVWQRNWPTSGNQHRRGTVENSVFITTQQNFGLDKRRRR